MLRVESVTSFIEKGLNEVSQEKGLSFKFKLFAEFGQSIGRGEVEGVVRSAKGMPTNIKDYEDIDFPFTCTLIVSSQISNYSIINVRSIVDKFIQDNNGKEIAIDDGVGIFSFSMSSVGDYKMDAGYGGNVPVRFDINVRYTTNSITASNKHWFLNDMEIPYLSESVLIDKDGITRKINGESYSKTQLIGQIKSYKFVFPYDTRSELCTMLQQDILNGDFEKIYELKYYDGKAFTEEQPFISSVSIYKNADTSAQPTKTSMFNITFTDVDNGTGSVKYYIALCDTVFDNNSDNTRFFEATSTQTAQEVQIEYWESKISCAYEQIKAPNLNSIDITSQVYKNTNNYELFDLTNKNYAIIKIEQDGTPIKYYYYFVTNASIGAQNQVLFDLKLDTVQTYLFDENIEFSDCLISKAHLNRWIDNGDGKVSFDGTVDSKLFEREDIQNVAKRLIRREKISLYQNITNITNEVIQWLEENVICWEYVFLDPNHGYVVGESDKPVNFLSTRIYNSENYGWIDSQLCASCVPILKDNKVIYINPDFNGDYVFDEPQKVIKNAMQYFLDANSSGEFVFGIKLSSQHPFNNLSNSVTWELSDDGDELYIGGTWSSNSSTSFSLGSDWSNGGTHFKRTSNNIPNTGILYVREHEPNFSAQILTSFIYSYNKAEIIGANKNYKWNPKLLSSDYASIEIGNDNGTFSYDAQKINKKNIKVIFSEPLTPDITKNYIRYEGDDDGIYCIATNQNFTGYVDNNDTSLILVTEAYQTMIANNKNYFLQNSINRVSNVANGILSTGLNLATGNFGAAVSSAVSAGTGLFSSLINEKLTVDNMKNAPSSINNSKGNILLNFMTAKIGPYIEEYDILPNEKNIINDYMDIYGFTYNQIDNIKNVWNIRKYHNYVQATLDAITGVSMSNVARADLKQRFQTGIRFWNSDIVQYNLENYEKWLEN